MARTEVFTCDICKQSKSKDDLAHMSVRSDGIMIKDSRYLTIEIDICPDCLRKRGFVVEPPKDDDEKQQTEKRNEVTLEDKIYDFLHDIGVVFEE